MARKTRSRVQAAPTPFEQARDELFQHVIRCGVIGAAPEHQAEWFADTMGYVRDRYPELDEDQLGELRTLGERFSQPPKTRSDDDETVDAASAA